MTPIFIASDSAFNCDMTVTDFIDYGYYFNRP